MTRILAVETSTEACSCALWCDGELDEDFALIPRQHTQQLLPMVARLLARGQLGFADLDAIAVGRGPGSFTGLRIAMGVAQGLAFAAGLPLLPVSTLATLVSQVASEGALIKDSWIFSSMDARIDQMYWGWYRWDAKGPQLYGEENLTGPEQVSLAPHESPVIGVGSGLVFRERLPWELQQRLVSAYPDCLPRSRHVASLAASRWLAGDRGVSPELAEPLYLREKVTQS
jgi:tRNA threonylcarbamoyladenosine biosynthesis protein TsaB